MPTEILVFSNAKFCIPCTVAAMKAEQRLDSAPKMYIALDSITDAFEALARTYRRKLNESLFFEGVTNNGVNFTVRPITVPLTKRSSKK